MRWRVAAALAALHLLLAALAFNPLPEPAGDNAVYLSLARSLLAGEYRDLFDPAAPVHRQFPPGWPLLIAGALATGAGGWVAIKLLVTAFSAAGVALTYLWARRRAPRLALGVGLLVAASPGLLALSHGELSDVPFWAVTMGALLAWERLPRRRTGRAALASALTAAAYLTRTAGLPLLVAVAAWLLLRRRWRQLAVFAAIAGPAALGWALWTRSGGGYAGFLGRAVAYDPASGTVSARGMLWRLWENAASYAGVHLPALLGGGRSPLAAAVALGLVALAVYGWARRLPRAGVVELWTPLYLAMLLVWQPDWAGVRLLLPVYPALLLYAAEGLARLARRAPAPSRRWVPAGVAGVLLVAALPALRDSIRLGSACTQRYLAGDDLACLPPSWGDYYSLATFARDSLPAGSAVLSRKPALFWAASGLPGRNYPLSREPAELLRVAREAGARYVVLDQIDTIAPTFLVPVLIRRPRAFCVVRSLGAQSATLMGILPGAERTPDAGADPGATEQTVGFLPCGPEYRAAD